MRTIHLGQSSISCSRLAYGCWRIAGTWDLAEVNAEAEANGRRAILAAYDAGYTLFDHADIYCDGAAESIFGRVLRDSPELRRRVVIASKCGIRLPVTKRPESVYHYDFSAEHIIRSCEQSLRRLGVDSIDVYLLHRPDYLMDPHEVASAFSKLKEAGKAREFGVSNFRPSQVTALQRHCPMPLLVNQVEISLARIDSLDDGTLDQCLAEKMTPMAWSPLAGGLLGGGARRLLPAQEAYRPQPLLAAMDLMAKGYQTTRSLVALAWLLKHPSGIVPIIGSTNPESIREAAKATELNLSREDWYRLWVVAKGQPLP